MDTRLRQLHDWLLHDIGLSDFSLAPASADASFRRYFRVTTPAQSLIVMDAPPDHEDCHPFVAIAEAMAAAGLHVPAVMHKNFADGYLLLSDLGDQQYLAVLNESNAEQLYRDAMQALLHLQGATLGIELADYDYTLLMKEMSLFDEWFIGQYLGLKLDDEERCILYDGYERLASQALMQPQVCVHRDYHSRNLMYLAQGNPGILDFQDAVMGPITYDLVSLLRDCYICWPQEQVAGWLEYYFSQLRRDSLLPAEVTMTEFNLWFDWMGLQRHLKAIGIFSRLNIRDNKPGYLLDIPRTLGYVTRVSQRYGQLEELFGLLTEKIVPQLESIQR